MRGRSEAPGHEGDHGPQDHGAVLTRYGHSPVPGSRRTSAGAPPPRKTPAAIRVPSPAEELGRSQEQVDAESSQHWSYSGQVERGQRNVNLRSILKLAEVLCVDPSELVQGLRAP